MAHWDGTPETEEAIKNETKATIRCIPFNSIEQAGSCVLFRQRISQTSYICEGLLI